MVDISYGEYVMGQVKPSPSFHNHDGFMRDCRGCLMSILLIAIGFKPATSTGFISPGAISPSLQTFMRVFIHQFLMVYLIVPHLFKPNINRKGAKHTILKIRQKLVYIIVSIQLTNTY